ncbi:hypothetical protein NMY22_g1996 [Coprinellus aureogranulatus]|nr:hypothetical protein NMY22_g1996 [Coprinellus aureogranulatus]
MSRPSLVILDHFHRQIQEHHFLTPSRGPIPLHFNPATRSLAEFLWPCDGESRTKVTPDRLESFRRTHEFRAPCCLCPFLDQSYQHKEAVIGIIEVAHSLLDTSHSTFDGEYVAVCAAQRCGYSLRLEIFYPFDNLRIRAYPKRDVALPVQASVRVSEDLGPDVNHVGLSRLLDGSVSRVRGQRNRLALMRPDVPWKARDSFIDKLYKGIPESEFWRTFVQCTECKGVVLRLGMFTSHYCRTPGPAAHTTLHYHIQPPSSGESGSSSSVDQTELGVAEGGDDCETESEDEDSEQEDIEDIAGYFRVRQTERS